MLLLKSNKIEMILFFLLLLPVVLSGQIPNHTYPRIAIWQWEGAVPDWYARFDLAYTRIGSRTGGGDKGFIDEARRLNPNIIWLPTDDFNCAQTILPNTPNEWYVVDSKGNRLGVGYCPGGGMADLSDLCPRVNGQRLIDVLPGYLADLVAEYGVEGFASDGLYSQEHYAWNKWGGDVDLDRNGVNDLDEHGLSWALQHWGNGVEKLVSELRARIGDDKVIMINPGNILHIKQWINGYVDEFGGGVLDWSSQRRTIDLMRQVRQPPIFLLQSAPDDRDPRTPDVSKNYLSYMRYTLVQSMLLGKYYTFDDVDNKDPNHYWNTYYDEFDLDVGYPRGEMQRVKSEVWARFFDRGVAIANFSGHDETVSDQDLRALSGYNGPYYHFLGGQDVALNGRSSAMNNGQPFTSVDLIGYRYSGYHDDITTIGDGVILVKTPQTVVCDIIINNAEGGTSPVSEPARLSGGFVQATRSDGRDYYTLRSGGVYAQPPFAFSLGSGEARYTPNIGVEGKYEIFEWHASLNGSQASNVTYFINHAGGRTTRTVNQQINSGRWNSLGTFTFNQGTSGNVTISANGANGPVVADAIKFVFYDGNSGGDNTDTTAPRPPENVEVTPGN